MGGIMGGGAVSYKKGTFELINFSVYGLAFIRGIFVFLSKPVLGNINPP